MVPASTFLRPHLDVQRAVALSAELSASWVFFFCLHLFSWLWWWRERSRGEDSAFRSMCNENMCPQLEDRRAGQTDPPFSGSRSIFQVDILGS